MSIALQRYEDWPTRLETVVETARQRTFAWGRNDCCQFVAACIVAMTGTDLAAPYRGVYASKRGAFALLGKLTDGKIDELASSLLGKPLPTPWGARRGDVVLVDSADGPALAVCLGSICVLPHHREGLHFVGLANAKRAWRV